MTIEPIKQSQGVSRAKVFCDDCARDDVVACAYKPTKQGNPRAPDEGQVVAKMTGKGWALVKGKLRCPSCEAKRKAAPMNEVKSKPQDTAPPQPSKRQRLDIISMLMDVYDLDAGRYKSGDTDETVADVLDVRPGWVSEIRSAEFGPNGGNEDIEALTAKVQNIEDELASVLASQEEWLVSIRESLARAQDMKSDLSSIKKAVGPRILKIAGVK